MARFDVHELKVRATVSLVVDVPADLRATLRTRVVVPLLPLESARDEVAARLKPIVDMAGRPHVLMSADLDAPTLAALGQRVASLAPQRQVVVDAPDILSQGFRFQHCRGQGPFDGLKPLRGSRQMPPHRAAVRYGSVRTNSG